MTEDKTIEVLVEAKQVGTPKSPRKTTPYKIVADCFLNVVKGCNSGGRSLRASVDLLINTVILFGSSLVLRL